MADVKRIPIMDHDWAAPVVSVAIARTSALNRADLG